MNNYTSSGISVASLNQSVANAARDTQLKKYRTTITFGGTRKLNRFFSVKGKPRESVGRKATGLSLK